MTSETDTEFLDEMEAWVTGSLVFKREHRERLFALARRGAAMQWKPIETAPPEPMPVLYYSATRDLRVAPLGRDENFDLGFYDDVFCWAGTAHALFERETDITDPWMPTHWMPLPPPPAGEQE